MVFGPFLILQFKENGMMNKEILQILRSELRPALGCIGPIGVCYNVAQAYDAIGGEIKKITARVQWDRAKIDDVGLPGTEYPADPAQC